MRATCWSDHVTTRPTTCRESVNKASKQAAALAPFRYSIGEPAGRCSGAVSILHRRASRPLLWRRFDTPSASQQAAALAPFRHSIGEPAGRCSGAVSTLHRRASRPLLWRHFDTPSASKQAAALAPFRHCIGEQAGRRVSRRHATRQDGRYARPAKTRKEALESPVSIRPARLPAMAVLAILGSVH